MTAAYPHLEEETGSVAAVGSALIPLVLNGRSLGVLILEFREPHPFTEGERRFLQALARQTALIGSMLTLSRSGRQEIQVQSVVLNAPTAQARQDAAEEFGAHPVRWQVGALPTVQGDENLLQQVMTNLLSNAVKYSAKWERSEVRVWCEASASAWTIRVQDNGVGFDPAYARKLFGIFQRLHTEKEFDGTGVGLATVKRIVQKHGGQAGATFGFSLPRPH